MKVISAGLPKSGSAWYFYMTNDLLEKAGFSDTRKIRNRFALNDIIKFSTCNIQRLNEEKIDRLCAPELRELTFAVKTHFPPCENLIPLLRNGQFKATFIIRDPRDIIVSGLEAGAKYRAEGKGDYFALLTTVEEAVDWAEDWLQKSWIQWHKIPEVLQVRYEDLLEDTTFELMRLCRHLDIDIAQEIITDVLNSWSADGIGSHKGRIHFNKARSGGCRETMKDTDKELCLRRLGFYIKEMGYPL